MVSARRQAETIGGFQQDVLSFGIGCGHFHQKVARHVRVDRDFIAIGVTRSLNIARGSDAQGDLFRCIARGRQGQVRNFNRRYFQSQIEAVHQGATDLAHVILAAIGRTGAGQSGVEQHSAATGVGGGDQKESAGIADVGIGARDGDFARFDRLTQGFEDGTRKLGKFVHE